MTNKKSGSHKDCHSEVATLLRRNRKHKTIIQRMVKNYKFIMVSAVAITFAAGAAFGGSMVEPKTIIVENEVEKQVEVIVPQTVIYAMTDAERWEVASVVQAEAGGEPYAGKLAVAQCIFQAVKDDGIRPNEAVVNYNYTKSRPEPSDDAYKAVDEVFLYGRTVTAEPIKYFYSPANTYSKWHESQDFVLTINGHRFFAEK